MRDQHPDAVRIAQLCAGLPLAVRIAGARLTARPGWRLSALADRLTDTRARLDELQHADLAVRTSFAVGHDTLPADEARLLELIGWLGLPDLTVPVAATLADESEAAVRRGLDRLAEAQLIHEEDERYSLHDLIGLFAREQAAERLTGTERDAAVQRVLHWYIGTARAAVRLLEGSTVHRRRLGISTGALVRTGIEFDDPEQVVRWTDAEHRNLLAVAELALRAGGSEVAAVAGLAAVASRLFARSNRNLAGELINKTLLEHAGSDRGLIAQAFTDLGIAYQLTKRQALGVECLQRGAAAWAELDDRFGLAAALNSLGAGLIVHDDLERARIELNRAVELCRELGHSDGENRALSNLGALAFKQGRYHDALAAFERRAELGAGGGDLVGYAIALENIATTWQALGDPQRMSAAFERALEVHREAGDRHGIVGALWGCGEARHEHELGDTAGARACWVEAVDLLVKIDHLTADQGEALLAAEVPENPLNYQ